MIRHYKLWLTININPNNTDTLILTPTVYVRILWYWPQQYGYFDIDPNNTDILILTPTVRILWYWPQQYGYFDIDPNSTDTLILTSTLRINWYWPQQFGYLNIDPNSTDTLIWYPTVRILIIENIDANFSFKFHYRHALSCLFVVCFQNAHFVSIVIAIILLIHFYFLTQTKHTLTSFVLNQHSQN